MTTTAPETLWGEGEYELAEEAFAPIYDQLVRRLAPAPGERLLDVATGTGAIAVRAARAGARVDAIDIAPGMIAKARRHPEPVDWTIADCQALPFPDQAFDVVASCFGVIFATDPERGAAELQRVCRDRLAVTAWERHESAAIWERYDEQPPVTSPWSSPTGIKALLESFDVTVERHTWWLEASSGAALFGWTVRAFPPRRACYQELTATEARALRDELVELYERHRRHDRVRYPQTYLLAIGARRRPSTETPAA